MENKFLVRDIHNLTCEDGDEMDICGDCSELFFEVELIEGCCDDCWTKWSNDYWTKCSQEVVE